jgi:hypothetical protein
MFGQCGGNAHTMPGAYLWHAAPMVDRTTFVPGRVLGDEGDSHHKMAVREGAVDYVRLLFSYTGVHVPRTRKPETSSRSVQGVWGEYPGARGDHAVTAHRC